MWGWRRGYLSAEIFEREGSAVVEDGSPHPAGWGSVFFNRNSAPRTGALASVRRGSSR